ncbi:MAG: alcohol dehydrogenase catalytic domain-containing protein [Planctomycetes bacterium]|nr:alcohol dehydrogenase catalytic domain-containing protein [Planctomycetota bacterium]
MSTTSAFSSAPSPATPPATPPASSPALSAQFLGAGRIALVERPRPEPGPGQLLIRVRANAMCGSEKGQFRDGWKTTPGHEIVGVVAQLGEGASPAIRVGDLGAIFLMDFCGGCRWCRAGLTNQCLAKRADMGFSHDGGYGAYTVVNENIFFPIGSGIPADEATLLLDVMGTGGHAIERAMCVHADIRTVLVNGAGPIGLGVAAMARILLGAQTRILVSDYNAFRLRLAEKLGAEAIDLARTTVAAACAGAPDVAVDTSGKGSARLQAMEALAQRGVLVCVGHGEDLALDVSHHLIAPERSVLGSEYFPFSDLAKNLARLRANQAYLGQIITHRFPISDLAAAFDLFWKGDTGKVIIEQR